MNGLGEILIVDDTPESLKVLAEMLISEGYRVRPTQEPELAIKSALTNPPDLILLDVKMPGMDGFEVCERLKQDERTQNIPIIFISALQELKDRVKGFQVGGVDFITKPIQREEVLARVSTHLDLFQMRENLQALVDQRTGDLKRSEAKYRRLVEGLKESYFFYACSVGGEFTYLSPSIENILGYQPEEFLKHFADAFTNNPINDSARERAKASMQGEQQPTYEIELNCKDQSICWLEVTETPVFDDVGQVVSVEGIAHDITERRALEEQFRQAQKMEAVGTLVGGIAHDFNNFLAEVCGNLFLARTKSQDTLVNEYIQKAEAIAFKASSMVSQLLAFARKGPVQMEELSFSLCVEEAMSLARASIPESIKLDSYICVDPLPIKGDATQVQQMLLNLLSNAKAALTDCEQPSIQVSVDRFEADKPFREAHANLKSNLYARLTVKDNGHGIAEKDLKYIFDPFFTTKDVGEGSGLGLAMAYGAIQTHGGFIDVDSIENEGASFYLYFPLLDDVLLGQKEADPGEQRGEGEMILVVDDEAGVSEVNCNVLKFLGYEVLSARDGKEGLAVFAENRTRIALILSDVVMPVMGGVEMAKEIFATRPDMPFIFLTGYDNESVSVDQSKSCKVLSKPVSIPRLSQTIRHLLVQKPSTSSA